MKTATRRTKRDEIVGRGPLSSPYLHLSLPSTHAPNPQGGTAVVLAIQLECLLASKSELVLCKNYCPHRQNDVIQIMSSSPPESMHTPGLPGERSTLQVISQQGRALSAR